MSRKRCPHRGDHLTRRGFMHSASQCPPPPVGRDERRRRKRLAKRAKNRYSRGVTVEGTGKQSANSRKKAKANKTKIVTQD